MKKKILGLTIVGILAVLAMVAVNVKGNSTLGFFLNHVEAYASDSEGAETDWHCAGNKNDCYAYCGACGSYVDGQGNLGGTHKCN